jgi:hypothetical protein
MLFPKNICLLKSITLKMDNTHQLYQNFIKVLNVALNNDMSQAEAETYCGLNLGFMDTAFSLLTKSFNEGKLLQPHYNKVTAGYKILSEVTISEKEEVINSGESKPDPDAGKVVFGNTVSNNGYYSHTSGSEPISPSQAHIPNGDGTYRPLDEKGKDSDSYNSTIDKDFEERSHYEIERDEEGKILNYHYFILVRDEKPFVGYLTREQMEVIYRLYPYTTLGVVSGEFPLMDRHQLQRILRLFGITKDAFLPQHIVEEYNDDEQALIKLRYKAAAARKKVEAKRAEFTQKELNKATEEILDLKENNDFVEKTIEKYLSNATRIAPFPAYEPPVSKDTKDVLGIFSDIHFGKKFKTEHLMYGRGSSKEILRERCLDMAVEFGMEAIEADAEILHLICLGDLFESIMPEGMHPGHLREMDLIGDEQFSYGVEVILEMIHVIRYQIGYAGKIILRGVGGNHDRIALKRDEDKERTAAKMLFSMVKARLKEDKSVEVHYYSDGIMKFAIPGLSFIGFHGDNSLFKQKASDLMNMFKVGDAQNFTLIMNGHYHALSQKTKDEGPNYAKYTVGSVCSADDFSQNQLCVGAQPSAMIIRRARVFGVNLRKFTLH